MSLDPEKWIPAAKDADFVLGAVLSFFTLWVAGHFGFFTPLDWLVPWFKIGFVVSLCFLFVSCLGAASKLRS